MKTNHRLNHYYKSIVRVAHTEKCFDPHFCNYFSGFYHVNAMHQKIDSGQTTKSQGIHIDKIRINHYWTKDEWFLHNIKIPRHKKWGQTLEQIRTKADQMNDEDDPIMHRFFLKIDISPTLDKS